MQQQRGGSIVNLSSVNALMSFGPEHLYSAAKGAIVSLTRSLATENGKHNIRVNVVCPGTTETETWEPIKEANPGVLESISRLYPLGRVAKTQEPPAPCSSWLPTKRRSSPARCWWWMAIDGGNLAFQQDVNVDGFACETTA